MRRITWRPPATHSRARWWLTHRLLPLGLVAIVAGLLLYVLMQPFYHPRVYLLFAAATYPETVIPAGAFEADDLDSLRVPPIKLLGELLDEAEPQRPDGPREISSPAALDAILEPLDHGEFSHRDVLIVWIRAQAVTSGGQAALLCGDFDPSDVQSGRYPLSELFGRAGRCAARTKLILLDAGPLAHAPRLGIFAGCPPRQIQQLVHSTNDPTLWVMLSHSELQRSHTLGQSHRSAFAHFVGEGLQGLADRPIDAGNGDRFVDLGELYQYVRGRLADQVPRQSDGQSSQTPALIWGGGPLAPTTAYPLLVPVAPPRETDEKQQVAGEAASEPGPPGRSTTEIHTARRPSRFAAGRAVGVSSSLPAAPILPSLPVSLPAQVAHEAAQLASPDATSKSADQQQRPSQPAESSQAPKELGPTEESSPTTEAADSDPSAQPLPDQAGPADQRTAAVESPVSRPSGEQVDPIISASAGQLWTMAWSLHDRIAATARPCPVDDAPHLWRALENRLESLATAWGSGDPQQNAARTAALRRLAGQLDDLAEGRTPQRYRQHDLVADLAQWSEAIAPNTAAHSLAMAERAGRHRDAPLRDEAVAIAARLDALIDRGNLADYRKWIAKLPSTFDQFVECRLARTLAGREELAWPSIQLALRACRSAEKVAAETLESGPWTRRQIERADRLRLTAQRSLLGGVRPGDSANAALLLQRAVAEYEQVAARNRDVIATQRLVNEAMFYLPDDLHRSVVSLAGVSLAGTEAIAPDPAELSQLLRDLKQAVELLDRPSAARLPQLRRVRRQLEMALDRLWQRISPPEGSLPTVRHDRPVQVAQRLRCLADLYGKSIRLSFGELSDSHPQARAVAVATSRFTESNTPADGLWEACGRLGEALRDFYQSVPAEVERLSAENRDLSDPGQRAEKIRKLRAGRRLLYLVHPWDVDRVKPAGPTQPIRRAQLYDLLVWQQRRLATALDDAPATQRQYLVDAAAAYRRAAAAMPQQPPVDPLRRPLVTIEAPQQVALAGEPEVELPLAVTNRHSDPIDVWLALDYDGEVLEVSPRNHDALYDETDRANLEALRPTFHSLRPGETEVVWTRLRRRALSGTGARIVVRAISGSDCVRHDLTVELGRRGAVDLVVEGIAGSWQRSEAGLVLYPFPNRVTPYTLYLVNSSSEARAVDFEILPTDDSAAASPPPGEVAAATAAEYLARIGASDHLAKVEKLVVPPGGKRMAIPLAGVPGEEPNGGQEPNGQAGQAEGPAKDPPPLSNVLLAVITDRTTQRRTIRKIEIFTQRPARYVDPHVQYDPRRRRVEIRVRASKASAIPPDGVWIACEPELPEAAKGQYARGVTLRRGAAETLLHVEVPPDAGPVFPLLVHVDAFKRAFRFEVPTDAPSVTVVPESNRLGVRILEPTAGTAYGPRSKEVTAALQIDVPHGLLLDGKSSVEIGVDVNRDRDLKREESLLLTSDRQVELFLGGIGGDGTLAIGTRVDDLHVTLPPVRIEAARANLIARLRLPAAEVWSDPVEVIFDGEAPRISRLQLVPGPSVAQGGELKVSVLASDRQLSGVAKVEAAIDLQRRGEFAEEPPPLPGSLQPDGRWVVKIPTAELGPGVYTVLVRATDRQGNASDYLKTAVEVTSKEAAAAAAPNRVDGKVVYGRLGKVPVAGVAVRLVGQGEQKRTYEATTDKNGRFSLAQVEPGDYELVAEGLVGGNRRTGQVVVKVPPSPAVVEPVEVILQTPR